jgi:methylated-DNA-protein-cysteine methyltransferase-like protein
MSAVFARVYALVRKIPRGRVATYGQLSQLLDERLSALAVGWAMRAAPDGLPWHRVVNARGGLSTQLGVQRALLEAEGVVFDEDGKIDLPSCQWRPRGGRRRSRP